MEKSKQEHFIKNIEIKNFKYFKDFKAEGFGRVNLIGGKNNVGKTAFMEACYVSTSRSVIDLFLKYIEFYTHRDGINSSYIYTNKQQDIEALINLVNPNIIVNNTQYVNKILTSDYQYIFTFYSAEKAKIPYGDYGYRNGNIQEKYNYNNLFQLLNINIQNTRQYFTIQFLVASNSYPNYMYDNIISEAKRQFKDQYLNNTLYQLFGFNKIDILNGIPTLFNFSNNTTIPLHELGQGIKSFIYYIASLLIQSNKIIFIDEIENGIHFTLLDKLWEIILTVSKEQNVQVFATTHSKECIESYARVAKKLGDEEIKYIKMSRLKDGSIYAGVRDYDMLQYVIDDEHEVR